MLSRCSFALLFACLFCLLGSAALHIQCSCWLLYILYLYYFTSSCLYTGFATIYFCMMEEVVVELQETARGDSVADRDLQVEVNDFTAYYGDIHDPPRPEQRRYECNEGRMQHMFAVCSLNGIILRILSEYDLLIVDLNNVQCKLKEYRPKVPTFIFLYYIQFGFRAYRWRDYLYLALMTCSQKLNL